MKKGTKTLVGIILAVAMMMGLTACGGGSDTLAGDWKMSSLEAGGQKFSAKEAETIGFTYEVSLKGDNTVVVSTLGLELIGTWSTTDEVTAIAKVKFEGEDDADARDLTFKLDGKNLVLDQDGQKVIFEKK